MRRLKSTSSVKIVTTAGEAVKGHGEEARSPDIWAVWGGAMKVGTIAHEITNYTDEQYRNYEAPRLVSRDQINDSHAVDTRQSVRISAGLVTTTGEVQAEQERLRQKMGKIIANYRAAFK